MWLCGIFGMRAVARMRQRMESKWVHFMQTAFVSVFLHASKQLPLPLYFYLSVAEQQIWHESHFFLLFSVLIFSIVFSKMTVSESRKKSLQIAFKKRAMKKIARAKRSSAAKRYDSWEGREWRKKSRGDTVKCKLNVTQHLSTSRFSFSECFMIFFVSVRPLYGFHIKYNKYSNHVFRFFFNSRLLNFLLHIQCSHSVNATTIKYISAAQQR